jgi:Ran GTPase-activating protein (RanGAP) involved in mRNA processing and transport
VGLHNGLLRLKATVDELQRRGPEEIPAEFLPWLEALELRNHFGHPYRELARRGWLALFTALDIQSNWSHGSLGALLNEQGDLAGSLAHVSRLALFTNDLGEAGLSVLAAASGRLPALRGLALNTNTFIEEDELRALAASPLLGRLTSLNLSGTRVSAAGVAALARSPASNQLLHLDLSGNELGEEGLSALVAASGLGALRQLNLAYADLADGGVSALRRWPACRRLEALSIPAAPVVQGLGDRAAEALASSPILAELKVLTLGGWRMSTAGLRGLLDALPVGRLQQLDLRNTPLGDEGAALLADSPALEGLRELILELTGIGPEGAGYLAHSRHLRNLEHLDLADNRLGRAGFQALTGLARTLRIRRASHAPGPPLPRLRGLNLSRTNPTRGGLETLARSSLLAQLEWLDLSRNRLGAAGAAVLASAPGPKGLRHLSLCSCALHDEGAGHLAASGSLGRVVSLDLAQNHFTDEAARSLAGSSGLPDLAYLFLADDAITDAGAEALLGWRPSGQLILKVGSKNLSEEMLEHLRPQRWEG